MLSRTGLRSLHLSCRPSTSLRLSATRSISASALRSYSIQTADIEKPLKPVPEASASASAAKNKPTLQFTEDQWATFKSQLEFPRATHQISALTPANAGETVRLYGNLSGVHKVRRTLAFSRLSDGSVDGKTIQIVSDLTAPNPATEEIHKRFIKSQFGEPVVITGIVKSIENGDGQVEVVLQEMLSLNSLDKKEIIRKDTNFPLSKRHLQLRYTPELHNALRVRAKVASLCRKQLEEEGFLEVETPILFKSTPEGAREFLVPTRRKAGYCYALPQSPQQYKQILMASGVKRYYQLARCFRDEDQRADRQPEFTQLDIELGFANAEDVMGVISRLAHKIWATAFHAPIPGEIPRITYQYAMNTYGSDKPDLRYPDIKIHRDSTTSDLVTESLSYPIPADTTPETFESSFRSIPEITNLLADSEIHVSTSSDSITFTHTRPALNTGGSTPLGIVRTHLLAHSPPPQGPVTKYAFVWVTDFPLFTLEADEVKVDASPEPIIKATHHPFTSPNPEDIHLLPTEPLKVRGQHYDLVLNGVELGGGSARIHSRALQEYVLQFLGIETKNFEHLLKVLDSGCPPHAGMALGFDRLMAVGLGLGSVRDVIAFPKTGEGKEELVGSPSFQGGEAGGLGEYGLRVWKK